MSHGESRTWRWLVWPLGLLPQAVPMWWIWLAAMSAQPGARGSVALVVLVEVPAVMLVFALAGDFQGGLAWVRMNL